MIRSTSLANSLAVVAAVSYLIGFVLSHMAPSFLLAVTSSWLHAFNISVDPSGGVPLMTALLGFVSAILASWIIGYSVSALYNRLAFHAEQEEIMIRRATMSLDRVR